MSRTHEPKHHVPMMFRTMRHFYLFIVLLVSGAFAAPATELLAQRGNGPSHPTRVPVTLALMSTLPDSIPYRILRRADGPPYDVILFGSGADAGVLSEAVHDLLLLRAQTGDIPTSGGTMRVRRPRGANGRSRPVLPWAQRVVSDLRRAERRAVPGVGEVQTVEIWLPLQRPQAAPR